MNFRGFSWLLSKHLPSLVTGAWTPPVCSVFCVCPPHPHTLLLLTKGLCTWGILSPAKKSRSNLEGYPRSLEQTPSERFRGHFSLVLPTRFGGHWLRCPPGFQAHASTTQSMPLMDADFCQSVQNQPRDWDNHRDDWPS